jgi:predicted lipid-binding transport protein (Tim44 family)
MLRPRPALAALATVVAVAVGITACALTTHRPVTAPGGSALTTRQADTPGPPATTSPRSGHRTDGPAQPTPQPPATSPRISDPALAARQVVQAWQAGDRQRALQAATPSAVRTLFAFAPTPQLRFTQCRFVSLGYDCFYSSADVGLYYLHMRVKGGASAGYRVVSINALMRFGSPETAAKYVVSAWLAGDRSDARHAASKTVVDALWNHLGDRTLGPRFTGCTFRSINWGADCAFDYTTVGLGFTLQVRGGALLGWNVVAIRFAQL